MKKIFILFIFSFLILSCMTSKYATIEKINEIVDLNHNKKELFVLSNIWIAQTFRSAKSVVEYSHEDYGVIIGKGIATMEYKKPGFGMEGDFRKYIDLEFNFTIEVKDKRAKLAFYDPHKFDEFYKRIPLIESEVPAYNDFIKKLSGEYKSFIQSYNTSW